MVCNGVEGNNVMTKLIVDNCYHVVLHLIVLTLTDKVGRQQPVGYSVLKPLPPIEISRKEERKLTVSLSPFSSGGCY